MDVWVCAWYVVFGVCVCVRVCACVCVREREREREGRKRGKKEIGIKLIQRRYRVALIIIHK